MFFGFKVKNILPNGKLSFGIDAKLWNSRQPLEPKEERELKLNENEFRNNLSIFENCLKNNQISLTLLSPLGSDEKKFINTWSSFMFNYLKLELDPELEDLIVFKLLLERKSKSAFNADNFNFVSDLFHYLEFVEKNKVLSKYFKEIDETEFDNFIPQNIREPIILPKIYSEKIAFCNFYLRALANEKISINDFIFKTMQWDKLSKFMLSPLNDYYMDILEQKIILLEAKKKNKSINVSGGNLVMGDNYVNQGQAGAVGPNNQVYNNTFNQKNIEFKLDSALGGTESEELEKLIKHLTGDESEIKKVDEEANMQVALGLTKIKKAIDSGDKDKQEEEISKFRKILFYDFGPLTEKIVSGLRTGASFVTLSKLLCVAIGIPPVI